MIKKFKKSGKLKGFTLVELLVVMGVLLVVGAVVAAVFMASLRTSNKSKSLDEVRRNGNYAVEQVGRMIRYARSYDGVSQDGQTFVSNCSFPPEPTPIQAYVPYTYTPVYAGTYEVHLYSCHTSYVRFGKIGSSAYSRGILEFSLPPTAPGGVTITSAVLHLYNYQTGYNHAGTVDVMPYPPNGRGDPQAEIAGGNCWPSVAFSSAPGASAPYIANNTYLLSAMGSRDITLPMQAIIDMNNAAYMSPTSWYKFSLVINEGASTTQSYTSAYTSGVSPYGPTLTLTYFPSAPVTTPSPTLTPIPYQYAKITNFDGEQSIISCLPDPTPITSSGLSPDCTFGSGIASVSAKTCEGSQLMDTSKVKLTSCRITCQQNNVNSPPTVSLEFSLSNKTTNSLIENNSKIDFRTSATVRNY